MYVSELKMQKYYMTIAVITVFFIFTDYFFNQVESVENSIDLKYCRCLNGTIENRLMKCKCVHEGLFEIPNDLPTPLHEL